jgi:hypothetical protein
LTSLLSAWIFSRVLLDCHGGPEVIDHYELVATHLRVTRTAVCYDEAGEPFACDETRRSFPISFLDFPDREGVADIAIPEDPVSNPDLLPLCPIPTCVTAWPWDGPVLAVDSGGNTNLEACP